MEFRFALLLVLLRIYHFLGIELDVEKVWDELTLTDIQLKVVRAVEMGYTSTKEIQDLTGIACNRVTFILNGLKKWKFVDYVRTDDVYSNGVSVRRWFLTEAFNCQELKK